MCAPLHACCLQIETWPFTEVDGPLYNVRDVVQPPGAVMDYGPYADLLTGRREMPQLAPPPHDVQEGAPVEEQAAPPYAGASRLLRWSTQIVLSSGYDQRHPLSSKVEVTLQLRELAAELGISPRGAAHIAALCGHRHARATKAGCTPCVERGHAQRLCMLMRARVRNALLNTPPLCCRLLPPQVPRAHRHGAPGEPALLHARGQPARLPAHHQRCGPHALTACPCASVVNAVASRLTPPGRPRAQT
jgi:hypothetical protein